MYSKQQRCWKRCLQKFKMCSIKLCLLHLSHLYKLGRTYILWLLTKPRGWNGNESGFGQPLCTYRLNWARRTSWGWWDDCDDTVLQTHDLKFEPWRSEAVDANFRSGGSPQYWLSHVDGEEAFFVSFKPPRPGTEHRALAWKAAVLTTTLGPPPSNVDCLHKFKKMNYILKDLVLKTTEALEELFAKK